MSIFNFHKNKGLTELKPWQSINPYGPSIFELTGKKEYPSKKTMLSDLYNLYQQEEYKEILSDPNLSKAIFFLNSLRDQYTYTNLLKKNEFGLYEIDPNKADHETSLILMEIIASLVSYIYSKDDTRYIRYYLNVFGFDLLVYGPYDGVVLVIPFFVNGDAGIFDLSYLTIPNPLDDIIVS